MDVVISLGSQEPETESKGDVGSTDDDEDPGNADSGEGVHDRDHADAVDDPDDADTSFADHSVFEADQSILFQDSSDWRVYLDCFNNLFQLMYD